MKMSNLFSRNLQSANAGRLHRIKPFSIGGRRTLVVRNTSAPEKDASSAKAQVNLDALSALSAIANLKAGTATPSEADIAAVASKMIMEDPETAEQFKKYQAAVARVEATKAAAKELEDIFAQAGLEVAKQEAQERANQRMKADEVLANAEVLAAEKMLAAAQLEAESAAQTRAALEREANKDVERMESVKIGLAATVGGLASALPIVLTSSDLQGLSALLTLATTAGSCFLFGVVYRHTMRFDSDNSHLRSGAVGAFGLVRAASAGDVYQLTSPLGPLDIESVIGPAALYAGQSMILFAFSAAACEFAFRQNLVKRYGDEPL